MSAIPNNNTPPTPTIGERVDKLDRLYYDLKVKVDRIDAEFLQHKRDFTGYKREMIDKLNTLGLGSRSVKNKNKKKKRKSATKKRR
tara:strand:+ start:335 stop:592 length:258 start_codon:yes stop_codon:yes gene_type:complete